MRPSVLAVSLAAALLVPGAAALADPPWERGHEYEACCKYESKAGPHGFKEEYKCDGGGPRYAGGPCPGRQRTAGAASTPKITRLAM